MVQEHTGHIKLNINIKDQAEINKASTALEYHKDHTKSYRTLKITRVLWSRVAESESLIFFQN